MNEGVVHRHRGRRGTGRAGATRSATSTGSPTRRTRRSRWPARRPPRGEPLSIALVGNAAEIEPAWAKAGERFDVVTDQTSAHDALGGYVPGRDDARRRARPARTQPDVYERRALDAVDGGPRPGDARLPGRAAPSSSTTATTSAPRPSRRASRTRSTSPGFVPALHPAPVLRGPRAVPLGRALRRPGGHPAHGRGRSCALFPDDAGLRRWIEMAQAQGPVPGAPGADLLAGLRRAGEGRASRSTSSSRRGEVRAPIVIGRDHLDSGSVASPNRETEAMADGTDAVADWPLLNALVNTAAGATWVSHPPRRRRRDRVQPARRDGRGRRRHGPRRRRSWSGCSPPTRGWASSATSTRATSARSRSPGSAASASRCGTAAPAG